MRKALVAGNWKMNGSTGTNGTLVEALLAGIESVAQDRVDVLVCPPSVYLCQVAQQAGGSVIAVGAQDLCEYPVGAYTGEVSAGMLVDIGCRAVIVGHSERRALFGDTEARVAAKLSAALESGLVPVLCVGETLAERDDDATLTVVERQLRTALDSIAANDVTKVIVAYEPVWAIGTGRTATPEQAQQVHAHLRSVLQQLVGEVAGQMRILYGGSVNAQNAAELFAEQDIDGGLVGGASLKADEFLAICHAAGASLSG